MNAIQKAARFLNSHSDRISHARSESHYCTQKRSLPLAQEPPTSTMQLRSSILAAAFAVLAVGNPLEERASKPKVCPAVKRNANV